MAPKITTLSGMLALLISMALQPVAADIDYDARCERDIHDRICLMSFVWCDPNNIDEPCSYPENDYAAHRKGPYAFAALLWSEDYNLSWARTDPNYPVLVEWRIGDGGSEDVEAITWGKNFTDGETSFQFKFSDLAEEIADDDISIQHLQGQASQIYNGITISQPERPTPEDDVDYSDRTTQFAIYPSTAKHFLETQRTLGAEGMYNKWKLPVGLAVGLGVPVLMAISGIVGIFFGKRQRQSVLASKSSGTMEG